MPQSLAESYDELPFPSVPVVRSQPDFLATLARLRGLVPRDPAMARVLELGCAGGQNLVPLAERYPNATFVGVDISPVQIEAARELARAASVTNVEFYCHDLTSLTGSATGDQPALPWRESALFDYIIASAVYSWVDQTARDKLLAACRALLAPQGVAMVSYNCYPGWHVHDMFRATMRYEAREAHDTAERLTRGRTMLRFLSESLVGPQPYDQLTRQLAEMLLRHSDGYLRHDHLEEHNLPVYYRGFVEHARRHELEPLGDGVLGIREFDQLATEAEHRLATLTTDPIEREQYRDVVRNRSIRLTLLRRADAIMASTSPAVLLPGLFLASPIQPEDPQSNVAAGRYGPDTIDHFVTYTGLRLSTKAPLVKAALVHLGEAWPSYVSHEELVRAAQARLAVGPNPPVPAPGDERRLNENLWECCLEGIIEPHFHAQQFTTRPARCPAATELARWQARCGEPVTNRKHEVIRLDDVTRHLLVLLDGKREREQLLSELAARAASGELVIQEHGQRVQNPARARQLFEVVLPQALANLARNALLVA